MKLSAFNLKSKGGDTINASCSYSSPRKRFGVCVTSLVQKTKRAFRFRKDEGKPPLTPSIEWVIQGGEAGRGATALEPVMDVASPQPTACKRSQDLSPQELFPSVQLDADPESFPTFLSSARTKRPIQRAKLASKLFEFGEDDTCDAALLFALSSVASVSDLLRRHRDPSLAPHSNSQMHVQAQATSIHPPDVFEYTHEADIAFVVDSTTGFEGSCQTLYSHSDSCFFHSPSTPRQASRSPRRHIRRKVPVVRFCDWFLPRPAIMLRDISATSNNHSDTSFSFPTTVSKPSPSGGVSTMISSLLARLSRQHNPYAGPSKQHPETGFSEASSTIGLGAKFSCP
ncbi:hypothetical protein CONPUDRAFT_145896 [Coniophora puteana RWD-64-598 SS2]|uniref:Uncharacterized protein n=1 Tax=Coniophora puteana (strain RWD-64-598) TaxID=741705 RepID=A0A5M3MFR5_CONPW|nr:uncharacterized protein CONPUDRAFT_145896 [Coniophora puteana RWD-64-598 SS2]EIW77614.1 hypothetical protein CONPUDRAFT_145896 [Coniophora puteana RWD-64-598 SS2]